MNQPTEDRIKKIEEKQEDIDRRLDDMERKQLTEPIKVIIERQVEESPLLQKIFDEVGRSNTDIGVLKHEMKEARTDIAAIKTVQSGHSKFFEEHGKRLNRIEATMATKDDIARLEALIKQLLPPKQQP